MGVAMYLNLLAGLANGLKERLLCVHGADVDVAVGQGGHGWTSAGVSDHHVVCAMGGAGADAGRCAAGAGRQRVEGFRVREPGDVTDGGWGDGSAWASG